MFARTICYEYIEYLSDDVLDKTVFDFSQKFSTFFPNTATAEPDSAYLKLQISCMKYSQWLPSSCQWPRARRSLVEVLSREACHPVGFRCRKQRAVYLSYEFDCTMDIDSTITIQLGDHTENASVNTEQNVSTINIFDDEEWWCVSV